MRNPKCRICGKQLTVKTAYKIVYKGKNVYFCSEPESWDWLEEQKEIERDTGVWNLLYGFIKVEILQYRAEQNLPKYLCERLQDMRNGTTFEMGRGKVQRSKVGYPYGVILETFKLKKDDILYSFRTKSLANERQRINYMMAIIDNSINDVYERYLRMIELDKIAENKTTEPMIMDMVDNIDIVTPVKTRIDLSGFLDN